MFQWATDQFDKLTEVMAPPPTDAAGRFSYAVTREDESTAMGCIAEIDPVRTIVQQSKGWFPIHMACQYSMLRLIRLLMNQPGISIQQPDYAGMTPLHHACMTQKAMGLDVVKILLQEYNADPCVKNSQGQTPYDVATLNSIRQYLLPIQLQRETQYALDNGGVGLAPGIDLGGLKINRSNMAPPPQFGGAGVAAPPPAGGASNMASTPGQSRYPQTPGMAPAPAPAPAFGSPMATASSTPMSQPIPAAQPIARAPASMPGRKVVTNSARTKSAGASENARHARNGGSSLAVYSKYKADGFHSSSSDVGLQKKYGHHGANASVTTPPPSSGNAPGSGNLASSGTNPFSGAGNLGGVSRYASYGPTTAPAPSSVPIYGGMGFSQPAATQPNYFTPGATKAADAPSAGPTSPFMPPPPYSGTPGAEPVTPAAAVATTPAVASPFAAPAPAADSNLFDSPPTVAETPTVSEEPVQEETKNDATDDWVETTDPTSGQTYYFNTKTNETSWEKPNDLAPSTEATTTEESSDWVETADPSTGNVYYYNSATGETSWEKPSSMTAADATATADGEPTAEWVETTDPSSGNVYYYNTVTGETSWDRPAALDSEEKSPPPETSEPEPTTDSVPDTASSDNTADAAPVVSEEEEKPVEETPPEETIVEPEPVKEEMESSEIAEEIVVEETPLEETATEPEPVKEEMESSEIAEEIVVEETPPEETATEPEPVQEEIKSSEIAEEIVVEESNEPVTTEDEATKEAAPLEESTAAETETVTEIQAKEIKPDALPDGWTETTDPSSGKAYYYNTKTQETSWERPAAAVSESAGDEDAAAAAEDKEPNSTETTAEDLAEGWEEVQDPSSGKMYYFNKETQETSWEKPTSTNPPAASPSQEESDWVETTDPSTGNSYFYNSKTGETCWEKPAALNAPEDLKASETQQSMVTATDVADTATALKKTAQSSPVSLSHQRTMSADDLFASPPSGQAASFGSQLEEITDSEPQASPIATEKQPMLSAQDMFASPPSGQAANFGRPDFISPAAATQGSAATPGELSTPGGDTAEDLFGSPPAKVPETQSAEDLFGATAPAATGNVNEPVVEDDDGMTDIPLSPDPKYLSQPASTSAQPASAPAPAAQEDLFAAIGMPPPPFQRRR